MKVVTVEQKWWKSGKCWVQESSLEKGTHSLSSLFHLSHVQNWPYRTDVLVCPSTEALGRAHETGTESWQWVLPPLASSQSQAHISQILAPSDLSWKGHRCLRSMGKWDQDHMAFLRFVTIGFLTYNGMSCVSSASALLTFINSVCRESTSANMTLLEPHLLDCLFHSGVLFFKTCLGSMLRTENAAVGY